MLVNDIWGGELLAEWNTPLWEHDLDGGLRMLRLAIDTHLITSHYALPLLIRRPGGLVVEMTDGTLAYNATNYRLSTFYDLAKTVGHPARVRAGQGARAPRLHRGGADAGLDALGDDARHYGVTEATWREATRRESALRRDLRDAALRRPCSRRAGRRPGGPWRNGGSFSSGGLAREYGFTDVDGSRPDCWRYMVEVQDAGLPPDPDGYR